MRRVCVWIGAAPGTPTSIKEAAEERGLTKHTGKIPPFSMLLDPGKKFVEAEGVMMPREKDLSLAKKWGMLLVSASARQGSQGGPR